MFQIWRIYLDLWGHDCKKCVWPTFGCKLGQSDPIVMQLKFDMSCHLLNVYTKFQIDISKHVEEKSGKHGRTDGQTDGRTDIATAWYARFSNGRIKTLVRNRESSWCQLCHWRHHITTACGAIPDEKFDIMTILGFRWYQAGGNTAQDNQALPDWCFLLFVTQSTAIDQANINLNIVMDAIKLN